MLEEIIRIDLKQAMLDRDESKKSALRMVIGEIPRLNKKAGVKPTDQEIEFIIRKLIKSEILCIESGLTEFSDVNDSTYIQILNEYIPKLMTEKEMRDWIFDNVNFTQYVPMIKAMGFIMKELKGKVDGNLVKQILKEL